MGLNFPIPENFVPIPLLLPIFQANKFSFIVVIFYLVRKWLQRRVAVAGISIT